MEIGMCAAVILPFLLWLIRWDGRPSIVERLTIPPEELADRELRRKGILPPKSKPVELGDDGSGDPKWVQKVHAEQRRNFRDESGYDMPENI